MVFDNRDTPRKRYEKLKKKASEENYTEVVDVEIFNPNDPKFKQEKYKPGYNAGEVVHSTPAPRKSQIPSGDNRKPYDEKLGGYQWDETRRWKEREYNKKTKQFYMDNKYDTFRKQRPFTREEHLNTVLHAGKKVIKRGKKIIKKYFNNTYNEGE